MHLHILLSLRQDTPALCAPLLSNLELFTLSKASTHISSGNPARALEVTVRSSPILGPATKELIQSGLGSPQGRSSYPNLSRVGQAYSIADDVKCPMDENTKAGSVVLIHTSS